MDLILFGMQGSGKGTLGKSLAEKYGLTIFETGSALRKLAEEDTELGRKVKETIGAGKLVSDETVIEIVKDFIFKNNGKGILFDGIPRKIGQAKSLKQLLEDQKRDYIAANLEIKKETSMLRLTTRKICELCKAVYPAVYTAENCNNKLADGTICNGKLIRRHDDKPEIIEERINQFLLETIPAMEIYKEKMILIDGEPPIDEVQTIAYEKLDKYFK